MRKHILIAATSAAVIMAAAITTACSQESMPDQTEEGISGQQEIVISAYPADVAQASRSSRDAEGNFYWSPGDKISLFYGSGSNGGAMFTSTNTESVQNADFTGTLDMITGSFENEGDGKFWAIYPYSETNSCSGTTVVIEVLSEQTAAEGTFADGQFVSIACASGLSMGFYHLCGGVKFFLENEGITKITLRGNSGETLAGIVEVEMDNLGHPSAYKYIEPSSEVILYPPIGEERFRSGTEYFLVTLPVTFEKGFSVTFSREDGTVGTRYVNSSMTVNRAKFQWSELPVDTGVDFSDGYHGDVEYFDIENDGVRQFLETVDYSDDPEYTYTKVNDFPGTDDPKPLEVYWSGTASSIILSTSPYFDADVRTIEVSESSAYVYNLIPGEKYYYRVVSTDGQILDERCVMPVGPLRMIYGVTSNMRDLGGWKVETYDDYGNPVTRSIKYGKVYRGYNIDRISSSGKDIMLNTLGVTLDMDLRGYDSGSAKQILSCDYVNYKVQQFLGNGSGNTEELYRMAIRNIIEWIAMDKGAVFFHCIGGADRTGTLAFLIEALLGVSESDLSKEYELTCYAGMSDRVRTSTSGRPFKLMIQYLQGFEGATIQDKVYSWATSGNNPLDKYEIETLRSLLLE